MLQQHVFPIASAQLTPSERVLERERASGAGGILMTAFWYVFFLFMPGAVAGLSVAWGRSYGLSVYRFGVSWLFFWVTGLLTLDPFVVRYRSQLSDLINHWKKVLPCTKTCLNVCFEHGFLYFAMLWSLSYAFVFIEAILTLFWGLLPAIEITTFAFGACLVVYLVVWIGRIVRQHSHLVFSNQPQNNPPDPPDHARFVEIQSTNSAPSANAIPSSNSVPPNNLAPPTPSNRNPPNLSLNPPNHANLSLNPNPPNHSVNPPNPAKISLNTANLSGGGGGVVVRLAQGPRLELTPSVQLSGDARLDLTSHLQRNQQQMTISGNVMTVEPLDENSRNYRCYRVMMWLLLIILAGFVLALILQNSFGWFDIDSWVQYVAMATVVAGVLLLVFLFGRRFSDPTYLQFFMILSTFFPTVYGAWLLTIYLDYQRQLSNSSSSNSSTPSSASSVSSAATVVMVLHLAISEVYLVLSKSIVRHFSGPYLYVRFMMLPQLMAYVFELVIFGFTPWSTQYLLVLLFSSAHNVMSSTGMYGDAWRWLKVRICPQDPRISEESRRRCAERRMFEQLLEIRYNMQLFAQDTIADIWSFVVVLTMLGVVYAFAVPVSEVMPSFTAQPISLRLSVLVGARLFSWLCGQLRFRSKLHAEANRAELNADPALNARGKNLVERLDEFLADLQLSTFQTAELRTCYEEDMPELFVAPPTGTNGMLPSGQCVVDPCKLTLRELMVMQIAERQWLLHPALLRKHLAYFHAIMYLLLFVVFQAASNSLPLRYAFFKPTPSP